MAKRQNDLLMMVRIFRVRSHSICDLIKFDLSWLDSFRLNSPLSSSLSLSLTLFQFTSFSVSANKFPAISTLAHRKIVRIVDAVYFNRQRYLIAGSEALIKIGLMMRRTHKTNSVIDNSTDDENERWWVHLMESERDREKWKLTLDKPWAHRKFV